jgi:mono/diheme cytochrome c family protein
MRKQLTGAFSAASAIVAVAVALQLPFAASSSTPSLIAKSHSQRLSETDLAIDGDLANLPSGSTRFLSRDDLLSLPLVSYTVADDPNFKGPTEITGVLLEDLSRALARDSAAELIVAVCDDQYHAHYPRKYLAEHHPLLVLKVNGQLSEGWPKDAEGQGQSMGPYLISHRQFASRSETPPHQDERQIPWGVVGLQFHEEQSFFAAIAPPRNASDAAVQAGYQLAQQNCLRCHNMGNEGGLKARHPWLVLSAWAMASPEHFADYVHNPRAENPNAQMPANLDYDSATLRALTSYFQTFQTPEKP